MYSCRDETLVIIIQVVMTGYLHYNQLSGPLSQIQGRRKQGGRGGSSHHPKLCGFIIIKVLKYLLWHQHADSHKLRDNLNLNYSMQLYLP